jgi:hypothetical protein
MPKRKILYNVILILILAPVIYSQSLKMDKKQTEAVFGIKGGYHSVYYPSSENRFDDGWIIDASGGVLFKNNIEIGINIEYWKKTIENPNYDPYLGITNPLNIKGFGLSFYSMYKIFLYNDKVSIHPGFGVGTYNMSSDDGSGNTMYPSFSPRLGMEWKINKHFYMDSEASYYFLIGTTSKERRIFNIKLGPSFHFN